MPRRPQAFSEDRKLLASVWQNPVNHLDVDSDSHIAPSDALRIVNHLASHLPGSISNDTPYFVDTSGDNQVSPLDVLLVVNFLHTQPTTDTTPSPSIHLSPEFEGANIPAVDEVMSELATSAGNSTILVATCDSSEASKQVADFVGDCNGDQEQINLALQALPAVGGTVQLAEGTYEIRAVDGTLGGVTIDRSDVILQGRGTSTKLILADDQHTNVIRIIGDGIENITVRDLYVNGNWKNNACAVPSFDCSGIRAGSSTGNILRDITVENAFVEDSMRLNIMIDAQNARVINNRLGDAGSDSVELLGGPGLISGNYLEIDDVTGYGLSTDAADSVTISDNVILVLPAGSVSQAVLRTWQGQYQHVISDNQVYARGKINKMLEVRGYINVITGNLFNNARHTPLANIEVDGASLVHDNIIAGGHVIIKNTADWASSVTDNLLFFGSTISQEDGDGPLLNYVSNNISTP